MNIELTEQQARATAKAARLGLDLVRRLAAGEKVTIAGNGASNPGDEAAAYKGVALLEEAVQKSVGG